MTLVLLASAVHPGCGSAGHPLLGIGLPLPQPLHGSPSPPHPLLHIPKTSVSAFGCAAPLPGPSMPLRLPYLHLHLCVPGHLSSHGSDIAECSWIPAVKITVDTAALWHQADVCPWPTCPDSGRLLHTPIASKGGVWLPPCHAHLGLG